MPSLFIDNVPASIYDRLQHLAEARQRTPADTVLEVLDGALPPTTPAHHDVPAHGSVASAAGETAYRIVKPTLCDPPFMTEEICAPFDIPWPEGEPVVPIRIDKYIPEPHDLEGLE